MNGIVPQKPSGVLAALDQFMSGELARFGRVQPVAPPPNSADLLAVPMICSQTGQPFNATFGRDRSGESYHVKSNRSTYAKLLTVTGYGLVHPSRRCMAANELDWTGFQCEHCGAGRVTGFLHDKIFCSQHQGLICGYRVEQIHGGGTKCFCPVCRIWGMLENAESDDPANTVTGLHYEAHAPEQSQAAPSSASRALTGNGFSSGGYGTSLTTRARR